MELTVGVIYPELLNMFGDSGNIKAIEKRLLWREIGVNIKEIHIDDEIDFSLFDIVYIGGGGEKEILTAKDKLVKYKDSLKEYTKNDGVLLAVCSGFELISKEFYIKGEAKEGLNILETKSLWNDKRFVSNVVINTPFGIVTGFENHNARMDIKDYTPLGEVIFGNGNNGEDKKEGVIYKNTFASFLDGPLLPKNPKLCDEIIKRALIKKYNEDIVLKELDDKEENKANDYIVNRFTSSI